MLASFFRPKKNEREQTLDPVSKLHIFMISGAGEPKTVTLMAADIASAEEKVKARFPSLIVTFIGHLADEDLYKGLRIAPDKEKTVQPK